MENKILWISGWACIWPESFQKEATQRFPDYQHEWLDFGAQTEFHWNLECYSHICAWSLGAKRLVENSSNIHSNSKFIFLAPAWDFCHLEFGWNPRVLQRMQKMLARSPENVLQDFYKLVGIPQTEAQKFVSHFSISDPQKLISGLEELKSALEWDLLKKFKNYEVLALQNDQLVQVEALQSMQGESKFANLRTIELDSHYVAQNSLLEIIQPLL